MLARMAQRRTETPLFRKALAAVVLWLLAWATIGYLSHRAIRPFDQRAGYREAMQGCADDRLELSRNGNATFRPVGGLEMRDCTERIRARYLAAADGEQRQVAVSTLAWALLPSLVLLLLAALAPDLRRLFGGGSLRR
jgi:hypothetical protein